MNDYCVLVNGNELCHHGIKGQKWGVRRFQNEDGSYKRGAEGRYGENGKNAFSLKVAGMKTAHAINNVYQKHYDKHSDRKNYKTYSSMMRRSNKYLEGKIQEAQDKANERANIRADKAAKRKADKVAIRKQYKQYNAEASKFEKMIYNDATRKQAARYVVKKNMSVDDALKKAKKNAWINTGLYVTARLAPVVIPAAVNAYKKNQAAKATQLPMWNEKKYNKMNNVVWTV